MKFSLILATRDRIDLFKNLLESILVTTKNKKEIEVIAIIDNDDSVMHESANGLVQKFQEINLRIISRIRSEWMHRDYINYAYSFTSGENIITLNDDSLFTKLDWDENAYQSIQNYLKDKPDGIFMGFTENFNNNPILSYFPLISRKAVEAIGFVMPNERKTWGADYDLFALYSHPSINRVLKLPCIEIKHISYHDGNRVKDHISARMENIYNSNPVLFDLNKYANELQFHLHKKETISDKTKVLVIYNICGINKNENIQYYCLCINSILNQKFNNFEILVSGCMTTQKTKDILQNYFQDKVHFSWVDEILPLNVTVNHAVNSYVKRFGPCEGYLYMDSGVNFGHDRFVIHKFYDLMLQGCAMVSGQFDSDSGYGIWNIQLDGKNHYFLNPGQTVNLHCQIFSNEILESYGGILPDIFASDTSESTFFYMCSALKMKFAIHRDIYLHHALFLDGASSGFRGKKPLLFKINKNINDISLRGHGFGFGYEECSNPYQGVVRRNHNPGKFDNGICVDDRLLAFIKENIFLQKNEFDYDSISGSYSAIKNLIQTQIKSPKITCIMVSHNKDKLVQEAIDSVLNQTCGDWELLLVDSGALFDRGYFKNLKDPRIKVIRSDENHITRQTKAMAPYCFNKCLSSGVHGELVVYLCDDDVFYPNAFDTFISFSEKNPYVQAMYASQDMITIKINNDRIMSGERRALKKMGKCVGERMDCVIDYLQFCHKKTILNHLKEFWPEGKDTESHADGVFMDKIGEIVPVYPIDVKVSQNRRTIWSTYAPTK
jgi:glycosyltransferase involved in cell wall biosynthesis